MTTSATTDLQSRCDLLRSLHRPGRPLPLPNAWDAATARAVVAAGFPVVATASGGVPPRSAIRITRVRRGDEMLPAAARIARSVEVPVTVDAEAVYGMEPAELVSALRSALRGPAFALRRASRRAARLSRFARKARIRRRRLSCSRPPRRARSSWRQGSRPPSQQADDCVRGIGIAGAKDAAEQSFVAEALAGRRRSR